MTENHFSLKLRKAKIKLEHEVLMKEMEVALIGMAGFPVTILTLIVSAKLYEIPYIMVILVFVLSIGVMLFDEFRYSRKEALKSKEEEINELIESLNTCVLD